MLSREQQSRVHDTVVSLDADARRELYLKTKLQVEEASRLVRNGPYLTPEEYRLVEYLIEVMVRIECVEMGRGLLYRTFRRPKLFAQHFKPRRP